MGLADAYYKLWQQGSRYDRLLHLPQERLIKSASTPSARRAKKTPPALAAELVAAYEAGETVEALAKRFDVHRTTVSKLLDAAVVARRPRGVTDDEVPEAVRLYADGFSVGKLARRFGISPNGMYGTLKRAGVQLRGRHERGSRN